MSIHNSNTVTRRNLLKGATALEAFSAFAPALLRAGAAQAAGAGDVLTGSHWGAFNATVENGVWTKVCAWDQDPHPTSMLEGGKDSVYSPSRIKYPMVRKAYLEGGPGTKPEERGSEEFVRVDWGTALGLVTGELRRVSDTYGPAGVFAGLYGWKSSGKLHNCQNFLRRALNVVLEGKFVNSSGDYSTGASKIIMPHVMGTLEVYEQQTVWPVVVESTDVWTSRGLMPVL